MRTSLFALVVLLSPILIFLHELTEMDTEKKKPTLLKKLYRLGLKPFFGWLFVVFPGLSVFTILKTIKSINNELSEGTVLLLTIIIMFILIITYALIDEYVIKKRKNRKKATV